MPLSEPPSDAADDALSAQAGARPSKPSKRFAAEAPGRLDQAVAAGMGLAAGEARRLLDRGAVAVNGDRATRADKGRRVGPGDSIEVRLDLTDAAIIPLASDGPLVVLAHADGAVVVDKPAGAAVHPLAPGEQGAVLNAVAHRFPQIVGVGEGGLRSGVVHRLDTAVSGCLAFAYTQAAWERLRTAIAHGKASPDVLKRYHAVVRPSEASAEAPGLWAQSHGELTQWLAVTRHSPARVSMVESSTPGARRCSMAWRWLHRGGPYGLIEVDLYTGFLHQIRVMLAGAGAPIVGDSMYGVPGADRLLLHARALRLPGISAQSPWPTAFQDFADRHGLKHARSQSDA
ncbi:MAG: RluA family pseudouridine synthase [Planctomycetota bacterium]